MPGPGQKLLFACDFEEAASAALPTVAELAKVLDASVLLVHVQRSTWRSWLSSGLVDRRCRDRLETWASRLRERGVEADAQVVRSKDAARSLAFVADHEQVRAIVVGGREYPGGKSRFEDRTTESLVRLARQPVWVVKAREGQVSVPRRILCGVDPSVPSAEALRLSAEIATTLGAEASVVHAVSNPDFNPLGMSPEEERREHEAHKRRARAQVEDFVAEQTQPPLPSRVRWGDPADVLLDMARDEEVDLLVLGPGRAGALKRLFLGSTARKVLYEAPISVLLIGEGKLERASMQQSPGLDARVLPPR